MISDSYTQNTRQNPVMHELSVCWYVVVCLLLVCSAARGGESLSVAKTGRLTITARSSSSAAGTVRFALFNTASASAWKDRVTLAVELPVTDRCAVWRTPALPKGRYALAVFHDINRNKVLDGNLVGMPVEPYGFSNNARTPIGPPAMKKAEFALDAESVALEIYMR